MTSEHSLPEPNVEAKLALELAKEEAHSLGHNYIGPEFILLGLIRLDGPTAQLLNSHGITLKNLRNRVQEILGPGTGKITEEIPVSPRAKRVLELSAQQAIIYGDNFMGPEHLLMGLIREGEGVAHYALNSLGCTDLEVLHHAIVSRRNAK